MNDIKDKQYIYNNKATSNHTKLLIYVALVAVTIFTWTQLDSIKKLQLLDSSDQVDPFLNNTAKGPFFTAIERDPATWSIQVKENEPLLSQVSIFPPALFEKDNDRSYPPVTAIINRIDDSDEGILHSVRHLSRYPFIKEIYIYNQMLERPLKAEQFYLNSSTLNKNDIQIEVIGETKLLGKYTACAMATYDKCWFQDDLWLNTYLDSLYTHSTRYPDHFVVNIRPSNYIDFKKWRFTADNIQLHTGYADTRYGAFISRQKVQKFLSQTSTQELDMTKLQQQAIDVYFSIWLNQYPYLISNPLLSNGRDRFKNVDTVNNRELVEYYMHDALSRLESSLQASSSVLAGEDDYFEKSELMPPENERDVRATCSNDRCLFITNMDMLPTQPVEFNSTVISNMTEFDILYNTTHYPNIPFQSSYIHQAYHKAVDRNTETCWNSVIGPRVDNYFGLYMTGDIAAKRVILYAPNFPNNKKQPKVKLDEIFKVTVQYRIFGSWEDCKIKSTPNTQLNYRIGFDFECPQGKREPFKSIRITFIQDIEQPLELCGIGLDNFVV